MALTGFEIMVKIVLAENSNSEVKVLGKLPIVLQYCKVLQYPINKWAKFEGEICTGPKHMTLAIAGDKTSDLDLVHDCFLNLTIFFWTFLIRKFSGFWAYIYFRFCPLNC